MFIALALIDEERVDNREEFCIVGSKYLVEQYFSEAAIILAKKPELKELGKIVATYL